jgi:hypothetical protein
MVLGFMMILMMLLLMMLVILGFINFSTHNARVSDSLARINEIAQPENGTIENKVNGVKNELQAISRSAFDANTLTYLFEIFTIALISGGLYLLNQSHRESREMKKRSKIAKEQIASISPFLTNTQISVFLNNSFSFAYMLTTLCKQEKDILGTIAKLRDTLRFINSNIAPYLSKSADIKDNNLPTIFLDYIGYITTSLKSIPQVDSALVNEAEEIESQLRLAFKNRSWESPI